MNPLELLLFDQSGVLTYRQALLHCTAAQIRHKVDRGTWRRIFRGVFVTDGGRLTADQQRWAAVLAAGDGSVLAGLEAARVSGLRIKSHRLVIDVLIPGDRKIVKMPRPELMEMSSFRAHRTTTLSKEELQVGKPMRTLIGRSILDAAQWALSDEEARTIVAAACQQRLVTPAELRVATERQPLAKRRALVLEVAAFAEGGATTLTEIDFVRLCRKHQLPEPDLQERRKDASGRMRYLDAYWRAYHLHVEIDGSHHMQVGHWAADMLRQNEVWLSGDRVLRFPAHLVRTNPALVVAQVCAALTAAGWHGPN